MSTACAAPGVAADSSSGRMSVRRPPRPQVLDQVVDVRRIGDVERHLHGRLREQPLDQPLERRAAFDRRPYGLEVREEQKVSVAIDQRVDELPRLRRDVRTEPGVDRRPREPEGRELIEVQGAHCRELGVQAAADVRGDGPHERGIRGDDEAVRRLGVRGVHQLGDIGGGESRGRQPGRQRLPGRGGEVPLRRPDGAIGRRDVLERRHDDDGRDREVTPPGQGLGRHRSSVRRRAVEDADRGQRHHEPHRDARGIRARPGRIAVWGLRESRRAEGVLESCRHPGPCHLATDTSDPGRAFLFTCERGVA